MKKNSLILLSYLLIIIPSIEAQSVSELAKELHLQAGSKASLQWQRVFSSKEYIQKYNLQKLSTERLKELKRYLIKHSADSEEPIVTTS